MINYFIKRKTKKIIEGAYLFAPDFPRRYFFSRKEAYLSGLKLKYKSGFLIRFNCEPYKQPVIMGSEEGVNFNDTQRSDS